MHVSTLYETNDYTFMIESEREGEREGEGEEQRKRDRKSRIAEEIDLLCTTWECFSKSFSSRQRTRTIDERTTSLLPIVRLFFSFFFLNKYSYVSARAPITIMQISLMRSDL